MIPNKNKGFLKTIILLIVALALLKFFFGVTVSDLWNNQVTQDIWSIIKSLAKVVWETLLLLLDFLKELIATAKNYIAGLNTK